MKELREMFIKYQSQFFNDKCMYSMIEQSDQNRCIRAGSYDDYILENRELIEKFNL